MLVFAIRPQAAHALLNANDLARDLLKAYGGVEQIKQSTDKGTRSSGHMISHSSLSDASNKFECLMFTKGDKMRVETSVLGNRNILAYDGKFAWTKNGDWVALSTPTSTKRLAEELKHGLNALAELDQTGSKLEVLPDKTVGGKECHVLKLVTSDGLWTIFYIDPVTNLVVRSEFEGHDSEQGVEVLKAIDYSEYRTVDGMPAPFRFLEYTNGKLSSETLLNSITMDDHVTDELFAMPPESKVAGIAEGPVVIPFEYIGNEIVIGARINEMPEARFIVDTGASQTVIDSKTAQALGPVASSTFNVTAGSKSVALNFTKIEKLRLSDISVENAAALVKDLSSFATAIGHRPAGLIGANVLRRFFVTIDYQNKKLVLADPTSATAPAGAKVIATSPVFGASALVVTGKIDGKQQINFLVDTGAAFNNLPKSLAGKLDTGPILPVGQIFGLDGKSIDIGAVKFDSIEIGPLKVQNPIFVIQPDKSTATGGLFSARAMGTLGNPFWSRAKLSVDYRNERLIIEQSPDSERTEAFAARLREVERTFLKNSNIDASLTEYDKLAEAARLAKLPATEALCIAHIAGCHAERYLRTKDTKWLESAVKEYERASILAADSKNRLVEGQILAQWSMFHLNAPRNNTDLVSHLNLLKRAFNRAPNDATIYAALGNQLVKSGKAVEGKRFINQALMFDPANWLALWTKFHLAESEAKPGDSQAKADEATKNMRSVIAQLKRYYPDFPQVKEAEAKAGTKSAPARSRIAPKK